MSYASKGETYPSSSIYTATEDCTAYVTMGVANHSTNGDATRTSRISLLINGSIVLSKSVTSNNNAVVNGADYIVDLKKGDTLQFTAQCERGGVYATAWI